MGGWIEVFDWFVYCFVVEVELEVGLGWVDCLGV